ncbi:hypothetical protein [Pseudomonas sp.]|uniref:hypothetical protein n=1 Tax=Pseudomonas sp. TaxID=306 RepID=UPI0026230A76|nr:hypothetical protein [Pseudomonas sp.]
MRAFKTIVLSLPLVALALSATAYAGPPIHVTFENQGSVDVVYTISSRNEVGTQVNASPKPSVNVKGGGSSRYTVQSGVSPDSSYAVVRYQAGRKSCQFTTTFVNAMQRGGVKVPAWKKSAVASGGAICTATITATNYSDYGWSTKFTMK